MFTMISSLDPHQVHTMVTWLSTITLETIQTIVTFIPSVKPEQGVSNIGTDNPETQREKDNRLISSVIHEMNLLTTFKQHPKIMETLISSFLGGLVGTDVAQIISSSFTNFTQNESAQRENPANEAQRLQFDFSTISNLLSKFLNSEEQKEDSEYKDGSKAQQETPTNELQLDIGNLVSMFLNSERQEEQKEYQQNDGSSDAKGKRDDYVDDLDLD